MPESPMQRRFVRFPSVFPLRHRVVGCPPVEPEGGWTHDLGGGGACVELTDRLRPEEDLRLRIRTDRGAIDAEARVVWSGKPSSAGGGILCGVAFTNLAPNNLETLRDLLLSLRPWRQTRGRVPVDLAARCEPTRPPGRSLQGRVGSLSRGGLSLRLSQALLPLTGLKVTLPTPTGSLTLAGAIAWVEPREKRKSGAAVLHGVRFTALDWPTALAVARFLTEPLESPHLSPSP